jgi:hypothetical protein
MTGFSEPPGLQTLLVKLKMSDRTLRTAEEFILQLVAVPFRGRARLAVTAHFPRFVNSHARSANWSGEGRAAANEGGGDTMHTIVAALPQ